MKRVSWLLSVLGVLVFAFLLPACDLLGGGDDDEGDEEDGDGDGEGDGDEIEDVPDDVNNFLDPEDIEKLEEAGMTIYTGDNPPNVEGTYDLDSLVISYDELGMEGISVGYYWIRYYDQTDDGEIKLDYEGADGSDAGSGLGAFIAGDGKCFSVFVDAEGDYNGCHYKMPSIHSGCKEPNGIANFQWGFVMKEKSGDNCDLLMPEGAVRIVDETDGMASEQ